MTELEFAEERGKWWISAANDPRQHAMLERNWPWHSQSPGVPVVRSILQGIVPSPKLTPEGRAWVVAMLMNL